MSNSENARVTRKTRRRPIRSNTGWPLFGAELAITAVTLSVVFGLSRLFLDNEFVGPTIIAALGSHLVAAALRRVGLGSIAALATSGVAMVFVLATTLYGDTTRALIPTATTWNTVGSDLSTAWEAFGVVKAPTELLPGFTLTIAVVVWLIAAVADLAAFRVRTVVEALVPAMTLFIFTAMLGQPAGRIASTATFLIAVGVFLTFIRIAFPLSSSTPIESTRDRQPRATLRSGLGLIAAAVLLGLVFGPLLPGAGQAPLLDWKALDGSGGGSRVTLSPLVDARGRLVEQTDVELFRVRTSSETGAYWRTTALDDFDGAIWGSSYGYRDATGTLTNQDADVSFETIDATFTVSNLGDIWFPVPFNPITFTGADAKWDEESSTLVTQAGEFTTGVSYTVKAAVPIYDPQVLREASTFIPPEINARYTNLPDDFSPRIQDLALELTRRAPTPYDKAIALQNHFRGNFDYTTDVPLGHNVDRIEQFLFVDQAGYCEQFAGTFAAMARSIGLPTRVAIGFTPGDRVGDEFIVRGRNYHAWPEVWIDGSWVPFEPTPGRGSPQAEVWTGVAPQQDTSRELLIEEEFNDEGAGFDPDPLLPDFEDDAPELDTVADFGATDGNGAGSVPQWLTTTAIALAVMIAAAGAWAFGVPIVEQKLRNRRRANRASQNAEIEFAWEDLTEALADVGLAPTQTETRTEYVDRVAPKGRLDYGSLATVASLTDEASYSRHDIDVAVSRHARRLVSEVEDELASRATQGQRFARRFSPGRLYRELKRR